MASSLHLSSISTVRPSAHLRSPPSISTSSSSLKLSSTFRPPPLKLALRRSRRSRRGGAVMADTAAASYANALSDVACRNNTLDTTMADVEKLGRIFSDPEVLSFFVNPIIANEEKEKVSCEIAASSGLQRHTANFVSILIDMNRIDIIQDIVREFENCYNRITGTEVAVVSSVVQLDSQHLAQIAQVVQKLTKAKNIRLKTVIDPSLVAGFTIRFGNSRSKLIDLSVKKHLDEIAAQLDFSSISFA
ncbi:H(+)-transporting two-sector ATPase protein [Dioscorea alata]|uniref:H(+)-transporting two-sector ATPase protein n=1 Tax=Dioscorea alata TaxID=55571 RepID=A0ACB7TXB4_DIOAL|nr:H(+)-transporting two-sector ATPase protein [Dioscorea alata]